MRIKWLLIIALLIAPQAQAQEFAKIQEVKTPAGFTAWLIEEHSLPLFAVRLMFKDAGYAYDPDGREGRAHLASDLLMEGAGKLDSRAFHAALEEYAIELSIGAGEDHFLVSLESLSEHKDKAFELMGLALTRPRFDAEALTRIKADAQGDLKRLAQNPAYTLLRAWQKAVYAAHPYAKPQHGTPKSLNALAHKDFETYRSRYLTRGNLIIAAAGDITPAQLSALIDAHLAALPAVYRPEITLAGYTLPEGKPPVVVEKDVPQTQVSFGGNGIHRTDPAYFDALVMNHILGGSGSLISRLGKALREEKGLTYSVNTELDEMRHATEWGGHFATRNAQVPQAIEALKATLARFAEEGANAEELEDAKRYLTGSFVLSLDSNAELASFLISMQLYDLGMDYLEKRNHLVDAVTLDGVNRMARRLVDSQKLLIVMAGKPDRNNGQSPDAKQ